jgi:phosphoesterase RecJ-like protein
MNQLEKLKAYLETPRRITITTHANPDADALGSSLGLLYFLRSFSHQVQLILPNEYPDFLEWMIQEDKIIIYEKDEETANTLLDQTELLFCLDFSGFNRLKKMTGKVSSLACKIALIDHHLNPEIKADFDFWNDKAAATAELVFDFIVDFKGKYAIDKHSAEFLYAGIMTDTGSFKHPSTSSKILRNAADLVDLGADVNKVSRLIYDTNSLNRLRFLGHALLDKLEIIESANTAYFVIEADDFNRFHLKQGDTEGLVNYALSIKDIVMAAIIIQRNDEIKLSFRSIGDVEVNNFAEEYFGGGGHKNAAGGTSDLSLEDTVSKFVSLIDKDVLNIKNQ